MARLEVARYFMLDNGLVEFHFGIAKLKLRGRFEGFFIDLGGLWLSRRLKGKEQINGHNKRHSVFLFCGGI
ncbi:hypothetical protein CFIMG_007832RA00001 [Ceratocystis fimbriata CBS 114723]|uniref:Uncharacterized protein n=1 Tax=Ceratocystis fimbriata CBS 114723 TaxID=1035309 RepID=A0A2C5WUL4_9PEZI|nr:hypothetical protein CFIMG_007832RA00001 [Ceratocystis fimbriata CBS 114723]